MENREGSKEEQDLAAGNGGGGGKGGGRDGEASMRQRKNMLILKWGCFQQVHGESHLVLNFESKARFTDKRWAPCCSRSVEGKFLPFGSCPSCLKCLNGLEGLEKYYGEKLGG